MATKVLSESPAPMAGEKRLEKFKDFEGTTPPSVDAVVEATKEKSPEPMIFAYTKFWTKEYRRDAEFELDVDGILLPVHKYVLSASPYFQKELAKAEKATSSISSFKGKVPNSKEKPKKIKFSSPLLKKVTAEEMILLLCHVYATDVYMDHSRIADFRALIKMARMFEFEAINARCMHVFRSDAKFLEAAREEMQSNDPKIIGEWLDVAKQYNSEELINSICDFAAENYIYIFGKREGQRVEKWSALEAAFKEDLHLYRRTARALSDRLEQKGGLSLPLDSANTVMYGILGGLFAGAILPSWLFYIFVAAILYMAFNQMPIGVTLVLKKMFEGVMSGVVSGALDVAMKGNGSNNVNYDMDPPGSAPHKRLS